MATAMARPAESGFVRNPDYRITFEPCAKRVRATLGGETIVDSTNARLLHESRHIPVYYFPREDVRMDLLTRTDHETICPFKGVASYFSIDAGGESVENAVWTYEDPYDETGDIRDYVAFYWNRMDHWYEEDEEVFVHARDPYTRIDILESTRHVEVELGGVTVADTNRALMLFETRLPVRYYIPKDDVRMDMLTETDLATRCPYKGVARYWSANAGGKTFENVVWSYDDPVHESAAIRGYLCFYNEHVDTIRVDGEAQEIPRTRWSKR